MNNISIAITKDTKLDDKYRKIFDHVIEIPFEDDAELSDWKVENKWKYFHFTPYDETVILDTDMLFTSDVSHWWDVMSKQDVVATTKVLTYRHELITSDYMRKTFTQNNLPKDIIINGIAGNSAAGNKNILSMSYVVLVFFY